MIEFDTEVNHGTVQTTKQRASETLYGHTANRAQSATFHGRNPPATGMVSMWQYGWQAGELKRLISQWISTGLCAYPTGSFGIFDGAPCPITNRFWNNDYPVSLQQKLEADSHLA